MYGRNPEQSIDYQANIDRKYRRRHCYLISVQMISSWLRKQIVSFVPGKEKPTTFWIAISMSSIFTPVNIKYMFASNAECAHSQRDFAKECKTRRHSEKLSGERSKHLLLERQSRRSWIRSACARGFQTRKSDTKISPIPS